MKRILTLTAIIALVITGCTNEPIADFMYSPDNPLAGEPVQFSNMSTDGVDYEWNFGDGYGSIETNPIHAFADGGDYTVQLKVIGKRGAIDVVSTVIRITDVNPVADFTVSTYLPTDDGDQPYETDIVFVGEAVEFYNTSLNATDYQWDFGDGYTSDLESPMYSYDDPGTYAVTLTSSSYGVTFDTRTKIVEVVEGINSTVRITVLEYNDFYRVEVVIFKLFETIDDWENLTNPSEELFTTALGKCVYEGLNNQRYYVDVLEENHNNYDLAADDVGWIETQILTPGYIHDFFAYVDYVGGTKKLVVSRVAMKELAKEEALVKKATSSRSAKENKFSRER